MQASAQEAAITKNPHSSSAGQVRIGPVSAPGAAVVSKGCKPGISPPFQRNTVNFNLCARFVFSLSRYRRNLFFPSLLQQGGSPRGTRSHHDLSLNVASLHVASTFPSGPWKLSPSCSVLAAARPPPPPHPKFPPNLPFRRRTPLAGSERYKVVLRTRSRFRPATDMRDETMRAHRG